MSNMKITPPCKNHEYVNAVIPHTATMLYEGEHYQVHVKDMICHKCHSCGSLTFNTDDQLREALADIVGIWTGKTIQYQCAVAGIDEDFLAYRTGIFSTRMEKILNGYGLPTRAEHNNIVKVIEAAKASLKEVPCLETPKTEPKKVKEPKKTKTIEELRKIADSVPIESHKDDARIGKLMRYIMDKSGSTFWELEDCGGFDRSEDNFGGFAVYRKCLEGGGGESGGLFPSVLDAFVDFAEMRMMGGMKKAIESGKYDVEENAGTDLG